jgi:hypothetical protein
MRMLYRAVALQDRVSEADLCEAGPYLWVGPSGLTVTGYTHISICWQCDRCGLSSATQWGPARNLGDMANAAKAEFAALGTCEHLHFDDDWG